MNRKLCAGIIAIITAAGIGGYNYFNTEDSSPVPKTQTPKEVIEPQGIGYIDLNRIRDRYAEGERMLDLKRRETRLQLELKYAMKPVIISPPQLETKPFDDSVWQKNAQTIISQAAEIEHKKKQAAEEYRRSTEAAYLQKRDEVNNQFLNEILNIKLKLQNADNMRLTDEKINELNKQLQELQIKRGETQGELQRQWIAEITEYAEQAVKADMERLHTEAQASMAQVKADAKQTQTLAEERNRLVMEQAMRESELRQDRRQQLLDELNQVRREYDELETKLIDEISDNVAKLAVIHKLKLVLAKRDLNENEQLLPFDLDNDTSISLLFVQDKFRNSGAAILADGEAIDLTDELIKEMDR
ncbi:MAG: hypothetical protein IJ563_04670 [Selenomonadaceae bacterium]|nr:hypothetical protein [Selenomonadaceae bacterium]MBR1858274.1 hypothetical protein [Selenomonadaceae bacterium]